MNMTMMMMMMTVIKKEEISRQYRVWKKRKIL
jgi:hypothetical protein